MEMTLTQIKNPLIEWYRINHRDLLWRKTKNPYNIWLSEIMLQQTRVEAVIGYYSRFLKAIPDVYTLSEVSEDQLMKLWEGLGYYNRARNLQKTARILVENYNGVFPIQYEEVLALPGIGEYTASAICSICYNAATPAVDGNVLRVVMRLMNCYDVIDDAKTKKKVRDWLQPLYNLGSCDVLTQALMELGATVCIPNGLPKCEECPLKHHCKSKELKTFSDLPVRKEKKKRKQVNKTVFILHTQQEYGIRKRSSAGLLANMWEFFNVDETMNPQQAMDFLSQHNFSPVLIEKQIPYTHIFSHVEWHMTAYYVRCNFKNKNLIWTPFESFQSKYALPTAFRVFIERENN